MSVTQYLQIPGYSDIENQLFSIDESLDLILIYDSMNCNISRKEKLDNIKMLMTKFSDVSQKNKILCLVLFCMLNTTFGYSIIQEFEIFRKVISTKYNEFIQDEQSDQHFIEILKSKKI